MKLALPVAIILISSLAAAWAPLARAAPPAQAGLIVVADTAVKTPSPALGIFDAGLLDPSQTTTFAHMFVLQNAGATPVTIDRLKPSCGCTTAILTMGGQAVAGTAVLEPGKTVSVRVQVRPEGALSGDLVKFVWVYTAGRPMPAATLQMKATFPPLVVLSPASLDFGTVNAGAGGRLVVEALLSPRLDTSKTLLSLTSGVSYVDVGPPVDAGTSISPLGGREVWCRVRYMVTLVPSTPAGTLDCNLLASLTSFGPMGGITQTPLPNTQVAIRAHVVGH